MVSSGETFLLDNCRLVVDGEHDAELARESLSQLLRDNGLCSMATVGANCTAHINTCFCAPTSDFRVIVFTVPATRHGENLERNQSVALTLFDSHQEWGGIVYGCQCFGSGRLLHGEDAAQALVAYTARHPRMVEWAPTLADLEAKFTSRLYEMRVDRFTLLDEARFGKEGYVNGTVVRDR